MLWEILWLDGGDTIIRGPGKQIQYNYVTLNRTLFLENVILCIIMSLPGQRWLRCTLRIVSQQCICILLVINILMYSFLGLHSAQILVFCRCVHAEHSNNSALKTPGPAVVCLLGRYNTVKKERRRKSAVH